MKPQQSVEDYLETIHVLAMTGREVHRAEVARALGVSQPAVTKAIKRLQELSYVTTDGMHILLTKEGMERATSIYTKHKDIRSFLTKLGVSEHTAEQDACRIEHVITDETYKAIKDFLSK
ncbi:MAG: metal-dependent transcriptional regulator [Clostridia bacterium]|nr:metal-dependent transcriptional regulator [Clostridia bacterium]